MSNDRMLSLQTRNLTDASLEYAKTIGRKANGEAETMDSLFHGLLGQDVFIGGHRFNVVGTVSEIYRISTNETGVVLNGVWQIGYDDDSGLHENWYMGDNIRMGESAVGYLVQPVASRPEAWRKHWEALKKTAPSS